MTSLCETLLKADRKNKVFAADHVRAFDVSPCGESLRHTGCVFFEASKRSLALSVAREVDRHDVDTPCFEAGHHRGPTPGSVKCTVNRDDSGSRLQMAFSRSGLSAAHMIPKPRINVKIISSIYLRNQAIGRSVLSRARRARGSGI